MYITHNEDGFWVDADGSSGPATVDGPFASKAEAEAALIFHAAEWKFSHPE